MRDRAWFLSALPRDNLRDLGSGLSSVQEDKPDLTCTMICSGDLARHGVSGAKDFGIWNLWY